MTAPLPVRLVLIAPRPGSGGPGDYAEDLIRIAGAGVADLRVIRHGGAGEASLRDVRALRREVRRVLAEPSTLPTVVHAELSGGAVAPFWAVAGLGDRDDLRVTATLHDPPRAVWFPLRTRVVARSRVLNALIHRPAHRWWRSVEARALRGVSTLALTPAGVEAVHELGDLATPALGVHALPYAEAVPPPDERPLAIGLFGYRYGGKGFGELAALRAALDPRIAIRVAGRGTEELAAVDGVEILGSVEGPALTAFFASVRALVLPYRRGIVGGLEPVPSSATQWLAMAHSTPVLATTGRATRAQFEAGGLAGVAPDLASLARLAAALVTDEDALRDATGQLLAHRAGFTEEAVRRDHHRLWCPQ